MNMPTKESQVAPGQRRKKSKLVFCLYVTAGRASSARALANLQTICREHFRNNYQIEIVDTRRDPARAHQAGVFSTPTLIKRSPQPTWTIVGDLGEDAQILSLMRKNHTGGKIT